MQSTSQSKKPEKSEGVKIVDNWPPQRNPPHYQVLKSSNIRDLETQVNNLVREGYIPVGGVQVVGTQGSFMADYYQAMWCPGVFGNTVV